MLLTWIGEHYPGLVLPDEVVAVTPEEMVDAGDLAGVQTEIDYNAETGEIISARCGGCQTALQSYDDECPNPDCPYTVEVLCRRGRGRRRGRRGMNVELIDTMGSDLTVVNAARVSYAKHHDTFDDSDARLLRYLARHGHWSPFAHPQASFRISANIAVARQLYRHQVGLTVNETSRRYVTDAPTFDLPDVWRSAPGKGQSKQGSSGEHSDQYGLNRIVDDAMIHSQAAYKTMIDAGVAPEQARLVLPMAMVTEWIWTGQPVRLCPRLP